MLKLKFSYNSILLSDVKLVISLAAIDKYKLSSWINEYIKMPSYKVLLLLRSTIKPAGKLNSYNHTSAITNIWP